VATKVNLFPQIRVARTTIKLVSRSISSHRFEYLAGKRYVASDWLKSSTFFTVFKNDKKVKNSEKKYFFSVLFFTVSQLFSIFFSLFFTVFSCKKGV
jgi:hypothetical protein